MAGQEKFKMNLGLKLTLWLVSCLVVLPTLACFGVLLALLLSFRADRYDVRTTGIYRWYESGDGAAHLIGFTENAAIPARLTIPAHFGANHAPLVWLDGNRGPDGDGYIWTVAADAIYLPYTLEAVNVRWDTAGDIFVPSRAFGDGEASLHLKTVEFSRNPARCFVAYDHYRRFMASWLEAVNQDYEYCVPANVTYRFGYANAPNDGIYFIDHLDETGLLRAPPVPERPGCRFEGWYADEALDRVWDFSADMVAVEEADGRPVYRQHNLYAKWTVLADA